MPEPSNSENKDGNGVKVDAISTDTGADAQRQRQHQRMRGYSRTWWAGFLLNVGMGFFWANSEGAVAVVAWAHIVSCACMIRSRRLFHKRMARVNAEIAANAVSASNAANAANAVGAGKAKEASGVKVDDSPNTPP
jgi:hypothetical protein